MNELVTEIMNKGKVRVKIYEMHNIRCVDGVSVWHDFLECIGKLSVTVLSTAKHDFPGGGLTGIVLIAESHLAIHTWPEDNYMWIELATCGNPIDFDVLDKALNNTFTKDNYRTVGEMLL